VILELGESLDPEWFRILCLTAWASYIEGDQKWGKDSLIGYSLTFSYLNIVWTASYLCLRLGYSLDESDTICYELLQFIMHSKTFNTNSEYVWRQL
jgi:hypothetical protein